MPRPKVYISGPITKGCKSRNLGQALEAHEILLRAGFAVVNPMLTMMLPFSSDFGHPVWLDNDLPWVACSDFVLRLPGESVGAEMEIEHAKNNGVRVYYSLIELIAEHGR